MKTKKRKEINKLREEKRREILKQYLPSLVLKWLGNSEALLTYFHNSKLVEFYIKKNDICHEFSFFLEVFFSRCSCNPKRRNSNPQKKHSSCYNNPTS